MKIFPEGTPKSLVFVRHLMLVALLSCINPFWVLGFRSGLESALTVFAGAIVLSAIVTGLALLFFTRGTGKDWPGNFIRALWVFAGLLLIGFWVK